MDELSDLTNASFRPGTDATIDWGQLDKPPSSDDVAKAREWLDGPGFIPLELSGTARAAWHLLRGYLRDLPPMDQSELEARVRNRNSRRRPSIPEEPTDWMRASHHDATAEYAFVNPRRILASRPGDAWMIHDVSDHARFSDVDSYQAQPVSERVIAEFA